MALEDWTIKTDTVQFLKGKGQKEFSGTLSTAEPRASVRGVWGAPWAQLCHGAFSFTLSVQAVPALMLSLLANPDTVFAEFQRRDEP